MDPPNPVTPDSLRLPVERARNHQIAAPARALLPVERGRMNSRLPLSGSYTASDSRPPAARA